MINFIARNAKPLTVLITAAALTACDIGDGNKIESIRIDDSITSVRLDDCIGSRLIAVATFTDGSEVNFTDRVNWSSSDTSVATITTRPTDRPAAFTEDFGFLVAGDSASEGATANISIEYFGLVSETDLEVTTTGELEEIGLSLSDITMAVGTREAVSVWGRTSDDTKIDLRAFSVFSIEHGEPTEEGQDDSETSPVTLDPNFAGGLTAVTETTTDATLTAEYCQGVEGKSRTASTTVAVVADSPSSLEVTTSDDSLALNTTATLRATAVYSNGGVQRRSNSTRFSQTLENENDDPDLSFSNDLGLTSSSVGNFRVTPISNSGTHEVFAQYVDLGGEDVAGATGTIDITPVNTQLQSPPYRLDRGEDILVGTSVDLAIIGLFDELNDLSEDIGDYEQDVTDFAVITYDNSDDIEKVVLGSGIALAVSAGTSGISVTTATDGQVESEPFTITTHSDEGAVVNSITVSSEPASHKTFQLRALANITAGGVTFDQDVSLNTAWSTADSSIIHVSNNPADLFGLAFAGTDGCTAITAHFMGSAGSATLNSETGTTAGCP